MSIHRLDDGDYIFNIYGDKATFLAILDINTYDIYDYDWDPYDLNDRLTEKINKNKAIAWGCPQGDFQLRVTKKISSVELRKSINQFSQNFETHGVLSICNFESLTMCAQYDDYKLPQPKDGIFTVSSYAHLVTVHQMFEWETGDQFANKLNDGDDYIVVFNEAEFNELENKFSKIPWSLR